MLHVRERNGSFLSRKGHFSIYTSIRTLSTAQDFDNETLKAALEDSIERIKVAKDAGED
jgi:hypothetical protein